MKSLLQQVNPRSIRNQAIKQFTPHCRQLKLNDDCEHEIQNISNKGQAHIIVKNANKPNKFEECMQRLTSPKQKVVYKRNSVFKIRPENNEL